MNSHVLLLELVVVVVPPEKSDAVFLLPRNAQVTNK